MKKVSKATIVKRIKRGLDICPICGCAHKKRVYHDTEYLEIWVELFCSHCGILLCFADQSPFYEVCDIIREKSNHITYKSCVKLAKEFNNKY